MSRFKSDLNPHPGDAENLPESKHKQLNFHLKFFDCLFDFKKLYKIMKTKIIGIFAIALAIGLSAFTNPVRKTSKPIGTYWFLIDGSVAAGNHKVPANSATFLQQSISAPTESVCTSGTQQCVSGFTAAQVNTSTDELKDDNEIPAMQPQTRP